MIVIKSNYRRNNSRRFDRYQLMTARKKDNLQRTKSDPSQLLSANILDENLVAINNKQFDSDVNKFCYPLILKKRILLFYSL